ncbi:MULTISPECIES: hypothetical protein [unclassified Streptomyces]|uniref:hypothetical protein n=1 Tax=unclassified Streptomyces TaxID=2593676 RepID=UPI002481D3BC|nr:MULTISPECIES: hypothetical protein [unclassified Streptomyces]MDA5282285.1 hypothetical protein [Streptomyces sp. Isolate_45]MDX2388880.1 hypothetical protein [Streptomyces sp. DK15]
MDAHGSTPPPAPARRGGTAGAVIVAVLLGLSITLAIVLDGDDTGDDSPSSSSSSPSSAKAGNGSWKTGDCGGPDPGGAPDGYRALDCGDPGATFEALEVTSAGILPGSIQCPAGTDVMIRVSVSYGASAKDGKKGSGIPTHTVCGRNLSGDHPGDAGAGGGQLVKGDCVSSTAQEVPCASAGADAFKVLDLVADKGACPTGTTEPMELTMSVGRPYDVICGGAA